MVDLLDVCQSCDVGAIIVVTGHVGTGVPQSMCGGLERAL